MDRIIKRLTATTIATILFGCASQPGADTDDAVADFIVVSELQELTVVRFRDRYSYRPVGKEYVILKTRDDYYLVAFARRCHELDDLKVTPDIRYDRNRLWAGSDTIRGCRISRMFAIDEAQAQELEYLGKKANE